MIHLDDLDDHPDDPDERYIKTDTDTDRHRTSSKILMLYTIGPFGAITLADTNVVEDLRC